MTYSESAAGVEISRQRAEREIAGHGHDPRDAEWTEYLDGQSWPMDAGELMAELGY